MKKAFVLMMIIAAVVLMGCGTLTYYDFRAVTDNPVGTKVGEASTKVGPTAIQEAAQSAGITRIATVDVRVIKKFFSVEYTYIVSGE
jgi:uncharacterized lipoprotein YmbA